ncbi:BZ3500_MvSof-1268-A1-R1_Chr10-1g02615 [Microbotryum saponariae]|uniref:BZ3500_MvSof-1268-A1-R1_Chr10-1g02615 protein n=1 Tax=Microbotryum saponariae TaxID=289078 RepID=A0A2X0LGE8_9BASI|nr:BZ3500_MvSof-1268-A1-R1_Chr10-1g02615 [Microbotryum saponariae]SDA06104.1 BZ3501_MvSof-1269-A2-R1_Chr10-1g02216 [Microbotryum saponariae]
MRSKIGDFAGFYLRASGRAFMGPSPSQPLTAPHTAHYTAHRLCSASTAGYGPGCNVCSTQNALYTSCTTRAAGIRRPHWQRVQAGPHCPMHPM